MHTLYINSIIASVSSAPSPTSMSEAFSLKQFGFNNAIGDPNQLDYTMQDVSAFSEMDTLPAMPNMFNQKQFTNLSAHPANNSSGPMQHQQINVSYVTNASTPPSIQNILDNNSEGLFRNNPNNPFFGIPSSMDWTEWNEWNQSNQGNTTWQPPA